MLIKNILIACVFVLSSDKISPTRVSCPSPDFVYFSWKIYNSKQVKFTDCFLVGLFAAFGFLSKYLFVYLLASIDLLFIYLIFIKKDRKFDFKYLITLEVFLIALVPHLIWLNNNEFITITYGLARTGLEQSSLIDHIKFPLIFLIKQIGLLIPFLILVWLIFKTFYRLILVRHLYVF